MLSSVLLAFYCFCCCYFWTPGEWTLLTPLAAKLPSAEAICAALPLALPPKPPNADLLVGAVCDEDELFGLIAGCFAPASVPTASCPPSVFCCWLACLERGALPTPPWIEFTVFWEEEGPSVELSGWPPNVGERISELCTLSCALSPWAVVRTPAEMLLP